MASGLLRSSRRHHVQYAKASSTPGALQQQPTGTHNASSAHQRTYQHHYQQHYHDDKQLRAGRQTTMPNGTRGGDLCDCHASSSAALIRPTPRLTTVTTIHPTGGICYETWLNNQLKMKKIQWTLLFQSLCQASGRLHQAVQLAINYPCEDVLPDNRPNAAAKISSEKREPTSGPRNLKCRCGGKSTQRFVDIPAKKDLADRKSCGLDFDGRNTSQGPDSLDSCKGALLQDFKKRARDLEIKINSAATTIAVRLHAGINVINIIPQDAFQTTSIVFWRDLNKEHTPMELQVGLAYKLETMNWQPQLNLLGFGQSDHQKCYDGVLTCVLMKPDKYITLLNIGTVDTDRKFMYSVLIEVQHRPAGLWIPVIILVPNTECNANGQHMRIIEFRIFLHTGYEMNMAKNCNEMQMWTLCKDPSDKRSAAYDIMLSRKDFDLCPNQFPFPGREETLLAKEDKFSLLFETSARSPFMWSKLCASADVKIDDDAVAAYIKLRDLKNVMEESTKGRTIKHHHERNFNHRRRVRANHSTEGRNREVRAIKLARQKLLQKHMYEPGTKFIVAFNDYRTLIVAASDHGAISEHSTVRQKIPEESVVTHLDFTFFFYLVFPSCDEPLLLQHMPCFFYVKVSQKQCCQYDLPRKRPVVAPGRLGTLKDQLRGTYSSFYHVPYASCKVIHSQVLAAFEASPPTVVERFHPCIKTLRYLSLEKVANVLLVVYRLIVATRQFFDIFVNLMVPLFLDGCEAYSGFMLPICTMGPSRKLVIARAVSQSRLPSSGVTSVAC
uniref:Eukaryotic translation initiation factor 2C n=1 Tax=Rhipicephalus appendiculatus TaxID=34631 RepID=A0A131YNN1_RHIAP